MRMFLQKLSKPAIRTTAAGLVCGILCGVFEAEGFRPFACAAYIAFVLLKKGEYGALIGAALGILFRGDLLWLIPLSVCAVLNTVWNAWQGDGLKIADRLIILCVSELLAMTFMHKSIVECALTALMSAVSVLFALALYGGISSLAVCKRRRRLTTDAELVHIGILLGLAVILLSPYETFSLSAARMTAGVICITCACIPNIHGMYAACIASLGAGFVYSPAGYSTQVAGAYIISCVAAALTGGRKKPKTILVFAFSLALTGTVLSGAVSIADCVVPAAILLFIPEKYTDSLGLYLAAGKKSGKDSGLRMRALARVTECMSAAYGAAPMPSDGELAIKQISAISELFGNEDAKKAKSRFSFEAGMAFRAKTGCAHLGDSIGKARVGTKTVIAVSDGMGSGLPAHNESGAAIETFLDMQRAGFEATDSIDGANRRLLSRGDDMYATLDILSADAATGIITSIKAGAPPSYLLRDGRITEICGESLPVGIVEKVTPAVTKLEGRAGDTIFVMTDGVHDALGNGLYAAVKEKISGEMTAKETADILLETAAKDGSQDDMSIVCIKISRCRMQ